MVTINSNLLTVFIFGLVGLLVLALVAGLIVLVVSLLKKSSNDTKQAELTSSRILQRLPQEKQMIFVVQYNSVKKNPSTAIILAILLGGFGTHKFYIGQTGLGIIYLIFCWTGIPAIIALIDSLTISGQVGKYNQQKALELAAILGYTN